MHGSLYLQKIFRVVFSKQFKLEKGLAISILHCSLQHRFLFFFIRKILS